MKWHRRKIPALGKTMETERFYLRSVGVVRALQLHHKINQDRDILALFNLSHQKKSWLQWFRSMQRPNGKSRHTYEIINKQDGASVGFHAMRLEPYRSASLTVVILDRDYWGKGVTVEVRKTLLPEFARKAGVECFKAQVSARNFPSIFNHLKLGFSQVGTQQHVKFDVVRDEPRAFFNFELMKCDFPDYFGCAANE